MNAIGKMVGWLGRKAVLYLLLVVAIAISIVGAPWLKQVIVGLHQAEVREQVLAETRRTIETDRDAAVDAFRVQARTLRSETQSSLETKRRELLRERATLIDQVQNAGRPWVLAITDRAALLQNERRKLRLAVIERELAATSAALDAVASNGASVVAKADYRRQQRFAEDAVRRCNSSIADVRAYEQRWRWRLRRWWESAEHRNLVSTREQRCNAARTAITRRNRVLTVARAKENARHAAQVGFDQAAGATASIMVAGGDLAKDAQRAKTELSGSLPQKLRLWTQRLKVTQILRLAAVAFVFITVTPFLIRLFCYFVLAPLAMRRPSIRLQVPEGRGVGIAPSAPSTTSVAVRLLPGEELLVRQDYLQTSSHAGAKGTQWFLDWQKPITSSVTGLTFLTRIRGDGEVTTVSAVRDSFAEVTILTLPEGASCVLQPRALAAVAQPIRRRLRITRHWRLGSLNAWLTMQLRYLVFHGPVRLVLKGGRGVRVEAAERGRVLGQDQLVGFSANLAYSVTRTETFWPYFLGREQLLKDRVMAGEGMLIVEEAPLSARHGEVRRGLEGMIDAGMKVFGM